MESIKREVNRRGTGHCTRRKPQSFKNVIKTGEMFWISAEVESRQKYHSPRILMSTTLKLFGSGKGDLGNWFELSESAPGFPQFFFFIMILYFAFVEKTPSLQVHFTINIGVCGKRRAAVGSASGNSWCSEWQWAVLCCDWLIVDKRDSWNAELKTFVFASLAHHNLYNRGAETLTFIQEDKFYIGAGSHILSTLFHISCRIVI